VAKTRDNYQITGHSVDEVVRNLNFMLQRLADRMDKIEGIRGTSSIESDLEMNSNRIREVASPVDDTDAARLDDLLTEPLTVSRLTVTGVTNLQDATTIDADTTVNGDVFVYGEDGLLIHSLE
jgi:hypothetical protein